MVMVLWRSTVWEAGSQMKPKSRSFRWWPTMTWTVDSPHQLNLVRWYLERATSICYLVRSLCKALLSKPKPTTASPLWNWQMSSKRKSEEWAALSRQKIKANSSNRMWRGRSTGYNWTQRVERRPHRASGRVMTFATSVEALLRKATSESQSTSKIMTIAVPLVWC